MSKFLLLAYLFISLPTQIIAQQNYLDTIWSGGISRTFRVYVPAIYDSQSPRPLLFNFHGSNGTAASFENITKFRSVADTANFILVTPNGTVDPMYPQFGQGWNNFTCCSTVDDVLFVSNLIDTLVQQYNLDTTRIYSAGYSNGGFMGYDLACKLSHRIAAIASVAGTMITSRLQSCNPSRAVPILEIHGTLDGNVPFNGGLISGNDTLASVNEVLGFWANFDACDNTPNVTNLPNTNPNDGSTVQLHVYPNCASGSAVALYKIILGGHTWPGLNGANTNRDIIAEKEIWNFFSQYYLGPTTNTTQVFSPLEVQIFPNPVRDILNIVLPEEVTKSSIHILDFLGQTVLQMPVLNDGSSTFELQLGHLPNGIYWLDFQADNRRIVPKKLLITRL